MFFAELYLSGLLKNVRFSPTLNYVVGSAGGLLVIAYFVHGAYRVVLGSVRDKAMRRMVINVVTLLAVLLTAEFTGLIFMSLHYLFRLSIGYFVGFVIAYFVLSMLINEALIYTYIKGVGGFGVHGGRRALIRLVSDSKYNGYTISMLYHDLVILMYPEDYEDGVIEVINAHEGYHARFKHTVILNAVLFISVPFLIYYGVRGYSMLWTALPLLAVLILTLARSFELLADKAVYDRLGPGALGYFRVILRSLYGIDDPRRAPIRSRITHPGRRDLVLSSGDVLGAYAPWEFPLLTSLFVGFILVGTSVLRPVGIYIGPALLVYMGVVIGSFLLTVLLGIVYRPIIRWFSHGMSNESVLNLSMLDSSVFTVCSAMVFIFYLIYHSWLYSNITAVALSFLFSLLVTWFVLRDVGRALLIAVLITLIFIALNYLYYMVIPIIHIPYFR
ncbi:hypothetical protein [Vulcanisaeta sp. JCM 16159]|uniref:hypothetical protein n=1 Tax=Vulcanisaeta sp. JCM 16159 TaxID=1295371 RepID=UPI001FB25AE0|nr:hypothetical protein [Vulcanisaeta sp. JCM 16159]